MNQLQLSMFLWMKIRKEPLCLELKENFGKNISTDCFDKNDDLKVIGVSSIDSLFSNIKIYDYRTGEESTLARRHPHDLESENLVEKIDKSGFGED